MFVGDKIAHGSILYKDYVDNKFPGIFFLSAFISIIFGKSIVAARCLVFLANAISAIFLFYIGKELFSRNIAKISSILFLLGMLVPAFQGYEFLTESFMILFGLLGILLYIKYKTKTNIYLSGFFIGIAILFKQTALLLLIAIIIGYIVDNFYLNEKDYTKNKRTFLILFLGVATPLILTTLYFFKNGTFSEFIYWTLISLKDYGMQPIKYMVSDLLYIFLSYSFVWILSGITIIIIIYGLFTKNTNSKELFVVFWILVFIPTFIVRQYGHYVIQILPPLCLLASISLSKLYPCFSKKQIIKSVSKKDFKNLYIIITIILFVSSSLAYCLITGYQLHESRKQLFKEEMLTSDYIIQHTSENESILIFSYEPSIYFLSGRNPPIKYLILNYITFTEQDNQYILKQLDFVNYIIIFNNSTKPEKIYQYIIDNYQNETSIGSYTIYHRIQKTKR